MHTTYSKEQYNENMTIATSKSIGSTAAVESKSALQERAKQLEHEFCQLEYVIGSLWEKLHPFLTDTHPVMEDPIKGPREQHSPMWEELDNAVSRLMHNRKVLEQLLDRVES